MQPPNGQQWLAWIVIGASVAWAGLRICPSCGHEATDRDERCAHCNSALPSPPARQTDMAEPTQPTEPTPSAKTPTTSQPALRDEIIADQISAARGFSDQGAWWGAILFARNAAAMLAIQRPQAADQRIALATLIRDARRQLLRTDQRCPVCQGTGAQRMKALTLKGDVVDQVVVGGKCPYCRGVGRVAARTPDDQLANEEAQAFQTFAAEQQRRGLEESRGLWFPPGLWDSLTPKQQAAARKGAGVPCDHCRGFGSQSCTSCDGAGILSCANANCASGVEICPDCNGRGRTTGSRGTTALQTRCETCNGTGKRTCTICNGKGFNQCSTCQGRAENVCRSCRGTGEGSGCSKCHGDGTIPCTRCNGTGQSRGAACVVCNGQGASLCKTCNGAGRISRR